MITTERIKNLLSSQAESNGLEFKEAKQNFDTDKLCKYIVAIANERGGYIIFGVTDKIPRSVVGSHAFQNLNSTESLIRSKTGLSVETSEHEIDGKRVVAIKIPSRPPGTAYDYKGQYLMRSGEQLVAMGEDRLRAIFAEGRLEWALENCLDDLSVDDVYDLLEVDSFLELWGFPVNEARR